MEITITGQSTSIDIPTLSLARGISVHPNPTEGVFDITFQESLQDGIIQVTSIDGKLIYEKNITTNKVSLDLSEYNNGIYLLDITSSQGTFHHKVIKH